MEQASQRAFDGRTMLYRWYVFVGDIRYVTWATTEAEAIQKTENSRTLKELGLRVDRVEPAPHII